MTKVHMLYDANGLLLIVVLTPGQAGDILKAQTVLDQVRNPSKQSRSCKCRRWLLADKVNNAKYLQYYCDWYRYRPVILRHNIEPKSEARTAQIVGSSQTQAAQRE
ncbi:hypothetical protein GCM10009425_48820 [Pseudomonas asuensis]|uniref:Transposase n=1 Tax=Pseudomonas asuensis TaxID=1825787 RepID=A0ABQ2H606_9PSED|nr:hypothetical protein GCM10009425_48820 [Pseudomonas asuensis]